jgi:hypothetical protein
MIEPLKGLIDALRDELQQYGEMLARLDQQQESIMRRAADDVLVSVGSIQHQGEVIQEARRNREQTQRQVAGFFHQPEQSTLGQLTEQMPPDYRPLVRALVDENNELLARVHQRARQNHLLLHRSLELMQSLLQSLLPTGCGSAYDQTGTSRTRSAPAIALYEAAG